MQKKVIQIKKKPAPPPKPKRQIIINKPGATKSPASSAKPTTSKPAQQKNSINIKKKVTTKPKSQGSTAGRKISINKPTATRKAVSPKTPPQKPQIKIKKKVAASPAPKSTLQRKSTPAKLAGKKISINKPTAGKPAAAKSPNKTKPSTSPTPPQKPAEMLPEGMPQESAPQEGSVTIRKPAPISDDILSIKSDSKASSEIQPAQDASTNLNAEYEAQPASAVKTERQDPPPVNAAENTAPVPTPDKRPGGRKISINKPTSGKPAARNTPVRKTQINIPKRKSASPALSQSKSPAAYRPSKQSTKPPPALIILPIIAVVIVLGLVITTVSKSTTKAHKRKRVDYTEETQSTSPEELAIAAFADAKLFEKENPDKKQEIIDLYQKITTDYPDTRSAKKAAAIIARYARMRLEAIKACKKKIADDAKQLAQNNKFDEAVRLLTNYNGDFTNETADFRSQLAAKLQAKIAENKVQKNKSILDKTIEKMFSSGVSSAYLLVKANEKNNTQPNDEMWNQLNELLTSAMNAEGTIIESIKQQAGQTVEIETKQGKRKINIVSVENDKIQYYVRSGRANVIKELPISELSDRERTRRVGKDMNGFALNIGIEAVRLNKFKIAKTYLGLLPNPIRGELLKKTAAYQTDKLIKDVGTQLALALRMAGVHVTSTTDFQKNLELLKSTKLSLGMRMLLYSAAHDVKRQTSHTDWIKGQDLNKLLKYMIALKPEDEEWETAIQEDDADPAGNNSENTDIPTEDSNIDWRDKVDF